MIIEAEGYEKHLTEQERRIMIYVERYGNITSKQAEQILQVKQRRAREILKKLIQKNVLKKQGNYKNTSYSLNEEKVLLNDSKIGSLL